MPALGKGNINHIVNISNKVVEELASRDSVRVIVKVKHGIDAHAVVDAVKKEAGIAASARPVSDKIFGSNNDFPDALDILNIRHIFSSSTSFSAEITREGLEILKNSQDIELVYIDMPVHAFLQDSVPLINATSVWNLTFSGIGVTGEGQTICIIDTGVNYSHPDLGGCYGNNSPNSGCKVVGGYDYINNDADPFDDNGHGTHVSGIAAANGTINGVAPGANIIMIKALNSAGSGSFDDVIAGIEWCTANATKFNISVISMSLGGGLYSTYCDDQNEALAAAVDNATDHNISVVAATGNDGYSYRIAMPACIKNVTAVGATTKLDVVAYYSNTNNITDLLAPGSEINSTSTTGSSGCAGGGNLYHTCSGTSMATPHVAGAIALLKNYRKLESNTTLTPDQAENALKITGVNITDNGNNLTFPRINILAALLYLHGPYISIQNPERRAYNYTSLSLNYTILYNSLDAIWYNIDGEANVTITGNTTFNTTEGNHTLFLFANDSTGQIGNASVSFIVDLTNPLVNFSDPTPQNNTWKNTSVVVINVSHIEINPSSIQLFINGILNETDAYSGNNTIFTKNLSDGSYNFSVSLNDTSGNSNNTETRYIFIDTVFPSVSFVSPTPQNSSRTGNSTIIINISHAEVNPANLSLYIDGNVNLTQDYFGDFTNITINLSEGIHNYSVTVNDSAGNSNSTGNYYITVDLTPPEIIFANSTPSNETYNTTNIVIINITANENLSSAVLEWNGTNESMTVYGNNSYKTKSNLPDGNYTFRVYANDTVNNTGVSEIRFVFINATRNLSSFFNQLNSTNSANNVSVRLLQGDTVANASNVSIVLNYTLEFNASGVLVKIINFSWLDANISGIANVTGNVTGNGSIADNFSYAGGVFNESVWVDMNGFLSGNFTPAVNFSNAYWIFFYLYGTPDSPNMTRINSTCNSSFTNTPCYVVGSSTSAVYLPSFSGAAAGTDVQAPSLAVSSPSSTTYTSTSISLSYAVSDNVAVDKCSYVINNGANSTIPGCANTTITASSGSNTLTLYVNDTSGNINSTTITFNVSIQSSSSAGGSSGGAAVANMPASATHTWDEISPSSPADMNISVISVPVKSMTIYVNSIVRGPTITVSTENPTGLPLPSVPVYQYVHIIKNNLNDSMIENATIEFEVNTSWLKENNLHNGSTRLLRYNESSGSWDSYFASKISENPLSMRYRASVEALSWFAITSPPESSCVKIITLAIKGNECVEYPTPCDVPYGWTLVNECPGESSNQSAHPNTTNTTNDTLLCRPCPEPSNWSLCFNGNQNRTEYFCNQKTNFTCEAGISVRPCNAMKPLSNEVAALIVALIIVALLSPYAAMALMKHKRIKKRRRHKSK